MVDQLEQEPSHTEHAHLSPVTRNLLTPTGQVRSIGKSHTSGMEM